MLNNGKMVFLIHLRYLNPSKNGDLSDVLELFYQNGGETWKDVTQPRGI